MQIGTKITLKFNLIVSIILVALAVSIYFFFSSYRENEFYARLNNTHENAAEYIFVDFFATWCGPCKQIAPLLEKYSKKYTNVLFLKVDVDQLDSLAELYQVTAMPTFMMFEKGYTVPYLTIVGANKLKIESALEDTMH